MKASILIGLLLSTLASRAAHADCANLSESLLTTEVTEGRPVLVVYEYSFLGGGVVPLPTDLAAAAADFALTDARGHATPLIGRARFPSGHETRLELVPKKPLARGTYTLQRKTDNKWIHDVHTLRVVTRNTEVPPTPTFGAAHERREAYGCGTEHSVQVPIVGAHTELAYVRLFGPRGVAQAYVPVRDAFVFGGLCKSTFGIEYGASYVAMVQYVGSNGIYGAPGFVRFETMDTQP